jgi:hypothetical protein
MHCIRKKTTIQSIFQEMDSCFRPEGAAQERQQRTGAACYNIPMQSFNLFMAFGASTGRPADSRNPVRCVH